MHSTTHHYRPKAQFLASLIVFLLVSSLASGVAHAKKKDRELPKLAPPMFSHESGFYPAPFELTLSTHEPDATIYYTLDGSEPDPHNLKGKAYRYKNHYQQPPKRAGEKITIRNNFLYGEYRTYRYDEPIEIVDRTPEPGHISRISTTYDENPRYFPELKLDETDLSERGGEIRAVNVRKEKYQYWINKFNSRMNWLLRGINRPLKELGKFVSPRLDLTFSKVLPINIYKEEFVEGRYVDSGQRIYKGTPVRAMVINQLGERSATVSHSLFVGDQRRFSLPIIAITVPERDLFDYAEGIFVAGRYFDSWIGGLTSINWASCETPSNFLYGKKGIKKPSGNIVFFQKTGNVSIDTKIRVHGNCSTAKPIKSIRIYPEKKVSSMNIRIFGDEVFGRHLVNLRNSGSNSGGRVEDYIRDAAVHNVTSGLAFGTQRYDPKITFINGEYNGILNARDRRDYRYLRHVYKIDGKQTDLLNRDSAVDNGSAEYYNAMLRHWEGAVPVQSSFYDEVSAKVDLESITDYFAASIFFARTDWPGNNIAYWRYTGDENKNKPVTDGRWRWLLYDADKSFDETNKNELERLFTKGKKKSHKTYWTTFVFRALIKNPELRVQFITRFSDLINTSFAPERVVPIIREMEAHLAPEMPRHIARWRAPPSMERWRDSINQMVEFSERRPATQRQHLKDFFGLGDLYVLNVDVSDPVAGTVKVNTLHLGLSDDELEKPPAASARATHMTRVLAFPWQGQYFQAMPLSLEAVAKPGYRFSHWEAEGLQLDARQRVSGELRLQPMGDLSVRAVYRAVD